jgi:hypothetical protein
MRRNEGIDESDRIIAAQLEEDCGVSSGVSWFANLGQDQAYRGGSRFSHLTQMARLDVLGRVETDRVGGLKRPLLYH